MKPKAFERKVTEALTAKGYAVERLEELDFDGYYLIRKGGKTSIIRCHNKTTLPNLDSIKALYGLKDFYKAEQVVLIAPLRISSKSKDFINTINKQKSTKNSYKLLSLDEFLKMSS